MPDGGKIGEVLSRLPESNPARVAIETAIDRRKLHVAVAGVDRATRAIVVVPITVP